jgi:hypothetical protein
VKPSSAFEESVQMTRSIVARRDFSQFDGRA